LVSLAVTAFLVGLSGALAPGPLTAMTISESARRGFRAGPLLTLGHAIAEGGVVAALALGLNRVFQHGAVAGTIAAVGGCVLLWMGSDIARSAWERRMGLADGNAMGQAVTAGSHVRNGILVSISNPYWVLWWATVGATYVVLALGYGVLGLVALFVGHIMSDLGWLSLVAFAASSGRRVVSEAVYRAVLIVCGVFLLALGVYFIQSGLRFWLGILG